MKNESNITNGGKVLPNQCEKKAKIQFTRTYEANEERKSKRIE